MNPNTSHEYEGKGVMAFDQVSERANPFNQHNEPHHGALESVPMDAVPNPFAETSTGLDTQPNGILFPQTGGWPNQQQQYNPHPVRSDDALEVPLSNQPALTPSGTTARDVHHPPTPPSQTQDPKNMDTSIAGRLFYSIQYYFDVDTFVVFHRMKNLFMPQQPPDYLKNHGWHYSSTTIIPTPDVAAPANTANEAHADIYGPFWTVTTLWVLLGIVSNLLGRINFTPTDTTTAWGYDFAKVITAASVVLGFWVALPTALWMISKFNGKAINLIDTLCIYGYSMLYFILATLFCSIPVSAVQYIMCTLSFLGVSAYLMLNLWRAFCLDMPRIWALTMMALTVIFQLALAIVFKFYFFSS